ncbi:glycosyltransferase family 2 protein [Lacinutrix salivirga]
MILLVHHSNRVVEVLDLQSNTQLQVIATSPLLALFELANLYAERILVWCNQEVKDDVNVDAISKSFLLKNTMLSFSEHNYLQAQIGYVEDSPFLKVNKNVTYPTWLMSSIVGAIYGSQLIQFKKHIDFNNSFEYNLNSIAKLGMPQGLFCYSVPSLLNNKSLKSKQYASKNELFKFVKQHYKGVWSFMLLVNFVVYDSKFPLFSFLNTLFRKQKKAKLSFDLEPLTPATIENKTIDVIIPTLGRKTYVHQVLKDLANQTLLPKQVIVIEQNDEIGSASELDFITTQTWPFKIIHQFIHQTGACNARNLALQKVTSDYVYLADDDNKFGNDLLEKVIHTMQKLSLSAVTMSYLQKNETEYYTKPVQWTTFGAGSSVIASKYLKQVQFNMALEFGYGEDVDFGMQLRNKGADIIYCPELQILHLKAPIGGFRTAFVHPWEAEETQPKPSPTVMLNRITNSTKEQVLGYKTKLFFQYYKLQKTKNPFRYLKQFKKQWHQSELWAKKIQER